MGIYIDLRDVFSVIRNLRVLLSSPDSAIVRLCHYQTLSLLDSAIVRLCPCWSLSLLESVIVGQGILNFEIQNSCVERWEPGTLNEAIMTSSTAWP